MIQLLEENKQKEGKRQCKAERERAEEKECDKQKAKTASIRRGKEKKTGEYRCLKCDVLYDDDKPDEIWHGMHEVGTYHMHRF